MRLKINKDLEIDNLQSIMRKINASTAFWLRSFGNSAQASRLITLRTSQKNLNNICNSG